MKIPKNCSIFRLKAGGIAKKVLKTFVKTINFVTLQRKLK